MLQQYDASNDGKLNRLEFCKMCLDHLWNVPTGAVDLAVQSVHLAHTARRRTNSSYWKRVANKLDVS